MRKLIEITVVGFICLGLTIGVADLSAPSAAQSHEITVQVQETP